MTPLNNITHKNLKISTSIEFKRFKNEQLIPVVVQDFALLATEFPIVFVKNAETGQFLPVAMMGVKSGVNLYCQTDRWDCPVMPLSFQQAPFSLAAQTKESDNVVVCIDTNSNLVSETDGIPLFNEKGEQTDYLNNKSQSLLDMVQYSQMTQSITEFLVSKNLLVARQLTVKLAQKEEPSIIDGIYLVDEKALNELSDDDFQDIRSKGLLPLIYAHLTSIHQISRLTLKHNALFSK